MKHWSEVLLHPRTKIEPTFWMGVEKEINVRKKNSAGHFSWKTELVYFDYDFLVDYFLRQLKALIPLSEDKIETLLMDALTEYSKILEEEKQKNDKT